MNEVKVYFDISEELEETLYFQSLNLETILREENIELGKEEIHFKGERITRGILSYFMARLGEEILLKIVGKTLEEALDQVPETTTIGKVLKPVLKWIKGNKSKEDKIIININLVVEKKDENGKEILELKPLNKEEANEVKKILLELKKEK